MTTNLAKLLFCNLCLFAYGDSNFLGFDYMADNCVAELVETIPIGLTYTNSSPTHRETFEVLTELVNSAQYSLDIASFYWTLLGQDVQPHNPDKYSVRGENLLNALLKAGKERQVKIRIAVNYEKDDSNKIGSDRDLELLKEVAEIRELNFEKLMGAGVLHTKFIVVDGQAFYVGSANMDWRSLSHVKELGIAVNSCPSLSIDLSKIFNVYWYLGAPNATIPPRWPTDYSTEFNLSNPMPVSLNGSTQPVFLSSSPKPFCPTGRTNDIDALVKVINDAKKFVYIAVMDYFPQFLYGNKNRFWPIIDDALKKAAIERKVRVRLLASHWTHTRRSLPHFLQSLAAINDSLIFGGTIEAKLFVVPSFTPEQASIPFARVNHNKYMVTDKSVFIGTSNWSADYFTDTAGVSFVSMPPSDEADFMGDTVRDQLQAVFERDWFSVYAHNISAFFDVDDFQ